MSLKNTNKKTVLFIAPYGKKEFKGDGINKTINFDKRYDKFKKRIDKKYSGEYIIKRCDESLSSLIYPNMFKMIKHADIVVANLTGINGNVMYELGVRHSLKERKTIIYRDVEEKEIPFDLKILQSRTLDFVLKNWKELVDEKGNDSPVIKELKGEISEREIHNLFYKETKSKRELFFEAIKSIEKINNCGRLKILLEYKELKGALYYDQKLAFHTYKKYEDSEYDNDTKIKNFKYSFELLKKHYDNSNTHEKETLGLLCSISRRIYELDKGSFYWWQALVFSKLFFSLYANEVYAISSYVMFLIANAEIDPSIRKKEYLDIESENLLKILNHDSKLQEDSYYKYTKTLIEAIGGKCSELYKDNRKNDHVFKTSKQAYERAIKLSKDVRNTKK